MKTILTADPVRYPRMTTPELRASFLIDELYQPGEILLTYVDLDRAVVGMAAPLGKKNRATVRPGLFSANT